MFSSWSVYVLKLLQLGKSRGCGGREGSSSRLEDLDHAARVEVVKAIPDSAPGEACIFRNVRDRFVDQAVRTFVRSRMKIGRRA
jgi:hypothetical protein